MSTATTIKSCSATGCAFNNNGCTALAITIAGHTNQPSCGTLVTLDARAGLETAAGTGSLPAFGMCTQFQFALHRQGN